MLIGIDASRAFVAARTGTENYSYNIIKEMVRLPTSQTHSFVLFIRPGVSIPQWAQAPHIKAVSIKMPYLWTQMGLAIYTWIYNLDVLWIPAHTLPVLRKLGLKTVVTIHGLEYKWLPEYKNSLQRWYLPLSTYYAAKNATRLIAVSKYTKAQLLLETGIEAEKVEVVYEGVDLNNKLSMKNTRVIKAASRYILFVGTLQPRKNLEALIRAFRLFNDKGGDLSLVIAGGKGWMAESIFKEVTGLKLQDKVVFTGRVSDEELEDLYRNAYIYVQPSVTEGFGLPILEAMKWGVPVVSSDGGALPEVVGEAGVVVKLDDKRFVENLAAAIERVASNTKERAAIIAKGRTRATQFGWQRAARETLKVLTK